MHIISELKLNLKKAKDNGEYWMKDIPGSMLKMDIELNRITAAYVSLSKEDKLSVCNGISIDIAWLLLCFAINMATYSLRSSNQQYFSNGLTALSMVLGVLDQREILLIMPLYYDVHKRRGLSFESVLNCNDAFSKLVRSFLNRDENDKILECMGYTLIIDENNNPTYQRNW
ncbi:MAG: hypothetical protein LBO81_04890 [Clostridiales Family XIII bacterium]|jgi:hypothetical protein|nr:hypothetical protein [Clostridiales Family XIII bacterium]